MNSHSVKTNVQAKKTLLVTGIGEMGGELLVSERILALLKGKYTLCQLDIYNKKHALRVLSFLSGISNLSTYFLRQKKHGDALYTTEGYVVVTFWFIRLFSVKKSKIIYHFHGTKATGYTAHFRNPIKIVISLVDFLLSSLFLKSTEWLAFWIADHVVVPDLKTYDRLKLKRQIFRLPSFVDTSIFKPTTKSNSEAGRLNVGYVGRIAKEKGIFQLVHACGLLSPLPELNITHVSGVNDYLLESVIKIVKQFGYSLHVYKDLDEKQVARLINNVDVTVLASQSEHFPLSLLESLACGVPMIATDVGDCHKVLSSIDKGLLLRSSSPIEIAEKLNWWSKLSEIQKSRIRKKSRKHALSYGLDLFTKRVDELFNLVFS